MVVRGDFKVQVVYANTKLPLKEHEKNGKIYVEAEPDADYFIAIRRVSMEGPPVILSYYRVDGKDLGYRESHEQIDTSPVYQGVWSRVDGIETSTALRFAKPKPTTGAHGHGYTGKMGKVEISLYEGIDQGSKPVTNVITSFEAGTVNAASVKASKKKFFLSAEGDTAFKDECEDTDLRDYATGAMVDRITLHYCSALGLVEAGVVPKPDIWTQLRMKRPVKPGQLTARIEIMDHPDDGEKEIEVVDLTSEKRLKFTW